MPRGPRLDAPGVLHHVIARGIERREIFAGEADSQDFLDRLGDLVVETETPVYAWCLIPNHFHLLVRSGAATLSTLMRRLLTGYAVAFNRRHRRAGHLFQNRFKSIVVEEEPYFLELLRYIHLNPLRAGLVADLRALDTYPLTGHAALLGRTKHAWQDTEFALAQFGCTLHAARRAYRDFVANGIFLGRRDDLSGGGLRRSSEGWQRLDTLNRGRERWAFDERILGSSAFVTRVLNETHLGAPPPASTADPETTLRRLLAAVAERFGLSAAELAGNSHRAAVVGARSLLCYSAMRYHGLSPTTIAKYLAITRQSVARAFQRAQHSGEDTDELARSLLA